MRVTVDRKRCQGHALCATLCPSLFRLDDLGYSIPTADEVPETLKADARMAVANCPEEAIAIENE
jgi:ferredoxin